jgi:mxaJ protein
MLGKLADHWPTLVLAAALAVGAQASAWAEEPRKAFRVCQDPNNLPFSNTKGEGYENKLAELFAKKLGLKLEYFSFPNRMGFVRNTLRSKLPGENYPCDIIMGVPTNWGQTDTTKAYYRSTYALVYAKGTGLDGVKTAADFLALDKATLKALKIGLYDRSPASQWVAKHDLVDQGVPFRMLNADPEQYPGELIDKYLATGKVNVAVVWGPLAGYFARKVKQPELVVVALKSEPGVKFDYDMAMGIRYGEPAWKAQIQKLIDENKSEITAILKEFGIPLVDESGALIN